MSVMNCAQEGETLRAHAQLCSATQAVKCCGIVLSVVISICVIELSVLFFHVVVLVLLVVVL